MLAKHAKHSAVFADSTLLFCVRKFHKFRVIYSHIFFTEILTPRWQTLCLRHFGLEAETGLVDSSHLVLQFMSLKIKQIVVLERILCRAQYSQPWPVLQLHSP
jgi:hypothetical protein